MGTTQPGLAANTEFGVRRSNTILPLILLAAGLCSALHAVSKPFWYDEICTVIVCRLPSASAVWEALGNAADSNPPFFYLILRSTRHFVPADHLGYRLPSILGLLGTISCIYVILSRRVDKLSALVGATFVLCTPLASYAYEARPYALMVGCISVAILAWQRTDDSWLYSLLLALALATAVSVHYYAVLVWPAFVIAEASVWVFERRFRIGAWAAFVVGVLPLLFFARLLFNLRQYYGQHFWAHISLGQLLLVHDWLFNVNGYWGWTFAVGITVIFLHLGITKTELVGWSDQRQAKGSVLPIEEQVLILMLLWLPIIAFVAATVSHGGMRDRYMLPTVLGGALVVGYLTGKVPTALRMLLLVLLLMTYGLSSVSAVKSALQGSLLEPRAAATRQVRDIVAEHSESGLPIVISSGFRYLPMAYYAPAGASRKLYAVADPRAAVTFAGTDSIDLALLVQRRYFPLQVEEYGDLVSRHREFFLVSEPGGDFDWLPARLSHDGHTLRLLSTGTTIVYKVTLSR